MQIVRLRVRCADGYTVSVQAGDRWNSEPRLDTGWYGKVELGYPTDKDAELQSYAKNKRDLCGSVYDFVPVKLVDEALTRLDETRQHLVAALRAVELAEQIGAMFGENKEVREENT